MKSSAGKRSYFDFSFENAVEPMLGAKLQSFPTQLTVSHITPWSDNITTTPLSDKSSSSVWSLVSRRQLFSPTEAKPAADRRPAPTSFLVSCQLLLVLFPTFMSAVCLHFYTLYVTLFRIFRGNLKTSPKPTGNLILLNMIPKDKVDRVDCIHKLIMFVPTKANLNSS